MVPPLKSAFLPFHRATILPSHAEAVAEAVRSGWLTSAGKVDEFERLLGEYVSAKHVVALNSCTAALHLALIIQGVGRGDHVITSPITFVSAVNVIEHVGAKPVFVDVREPDLTLDPEKVKKAITKKTKLIIATHFAGFPADVDELEKFGIPVVTDAAHAIETIYHGRRSGSMGRMACYSFYATKNITTGEGGALATNDPWIAERARILRLHGMTKDAWRRYGADGYKHWDIVEPGWKYNMSDINAALGVAQLLEIDEWCRVRALLVDTYMANFSSNKVKVVTTLDKTAKPANHLFVIRIPERDRVMNEVQAAGVGVGVHFRAVHQLKYYQEKYKIPKTRMPVAEQASEEVLSLPLYPLLEFQDIRRVVEVLGKSMK